MKSFREFLLFNEDYRGRELLILNIQPSISNRIYFDLVEFGKWYKANKSDFKDIYYYYNGDSSPDTMMTINQWFTENLEVEGGVQVDPNNEMDISELEDHFDGLLETNYSDADIVTVGKHILANNADVVTYLKEDEIRGLMINDDFKEDLVSGKYKFAMPYYLLDDFKKLSNPLLIGGLNNKSVRMFKILFEITNRRYDIYDSWEF